MDDEHINLFPYRTLRGYRPLSMGGARMSRGSDTSLFNGKKDTGSNLVPCRKACCAGQVVGGGLRMTTDKRVVGERSINQLKAGKYNMTRILHKGGMWMRYQNCKVVDAPLETRDIAQRDIRHLSGVHVSKHLAFLEKRTNLHGFTRQKN